MKRRVLISCGVAMLLTIAVLGRSRLKQAGGIVAARLSRHTVSDRLDQYGPAARARWHPHFEASGVRYPPRHIVLVGLKRERALEVWAGDAPDAIRFIREFPIRGMSGTLGPKLREGDRQVPEGLYTIDFLNPNSSYHLSLRISYPSDLDRRIAAAEGRSDLGGDIFIHGGAASVGCLAMGDEAAEDLFTLVAETGSENTRVILAPADLRFVDLPPDLDQTGWRGELYASLRDELRTLRR